jgi:hypothetical protein
MLNARKTFWKGEGTSNRHKMPIKENVADLEIFGFFS